MIGNDIIDLTLAKKQSNWKRKGFLNKIFTQQEQRFISESIHPEITVWNLWSRKEAAYKIYNRQTQIAAYIPLQMECFDLEIRDNIVFGKVICYDKVYYTQTWINSEYIETIAALTCLDFDKINYLKNGEPIVKINGIPYHYDSTQTLKPVSKTHHGRFEKIIGLNS